MQEIKVKPGYKMTELGVIPEDWDDFKLGDFCQFTQGVQIPISDQSREYYNGSIRYLYIRDFFTDKFPWYVDNIYQSKIMEIDDIMMVNTGNTAGFVYSGKYGVLSNNAFKISFNKVKYNPTLVFIYLKSKFVQEGIKLLFNSGGQPHVGHKNIAQVHIPFPAKPEEQKLIAQTLSDTDELINSLDELIEKKEKIKEGTMQELLTGKRRLPGFDGEWEEKTLGDIVNFKNGLAHENSISDNGKYIVVNSKFISTNGDVKKSSDECFCPVYKNDVLMVMSDIPNGKAIAKCFIVDEDDKYTLNQRICSLKIHNNYFSKFIYFLINRNKYYLSFDDGVKQTNLRKEDVLGCNLLLPPTIEEQKAISKVLSDLDIEIEVLKTKRDKYIKIKDGMMQELLTGKTRLV